MRWKLTLRDRKTGKHVVNEMMGKKAEFSDERFEDAAAASEAATAHKANSKKLVVVPQRAKK